MPVSGPIDDLTRVARRAPKAFLQVTSALGDDPFLIVG